MGCINSRSDTTHIFKNLIKYQEPDQINSNYKEMNIMWFKGNIFDNVNFYELYGHLGFQIPGGSIYGFIPNFYFCNNYRNILNGTYYGMFDKCDLLFETIKKKPHFTIHTLTVTINENIYNLINSWDNGSFNYKEINKIKYGIIGISKDTEEDYTIMEKDLANCITILDYFKPEYNGQIIDTQNGIMNDFSKLYANSNKM